jgi:hypothetical protein
MSLNPMRDRANLRAKIFGHVFTFTMPAAVTGGDDNTAELILADGRDQDQPFGKARFDFTEGTRDAAKIDLTAIRAAGVLLDGLPIRPKSITVSPVGIVARLMQCHPRRFDGASLSLTYQVKSFWRVKVGDPFDMQAFKILSVTVGNPQPLN